MVWNIRLVTGPESSEGCVTYSLRAIRKIQHASYILKSILPLTATRTKHNTLHDQLQAVKQSLTNL
jgi:hypothetical protein